MPYIRYYDDQYRLDEYKSSIAMKKKLLGLWPRKVVDGVEVFDILPWYWEWRRENGKDGCVLEPDEGYWEKGKQYLPGGFDTSKRNKKIYKLLGAKVKPSNYKDVKHDYEQYLKVFNGYTLGLNNFAGVINSVEKMALFYDTRGINTDLYPLANPESLFNYLETVGREKLLTNTESEIIKYMETVLGYDKVAICISKDTTYLEATDVGSSDGRIDRLYYYLGPRTTIFNTDNPNGTITLPTAVDEVKLYAGTIAAIPMVYPLHRDPFNPDPLLPYETVHPTDPTRTVWITPELTDMNPDPYKGTIDAQWDNNGWVTATIGIVDPNTNVEGRYDSEGNPLYVDMPNTNVEENLKLYGEVKSSMSMLMNKTGNKALLPALFDIKGTMFERVFRVVKREYQYVDDYTLDERMRNYMTTTEVVEANRKTSYRLVYSVQFKYRRIADPGAFSYIETTITIPNTIVAEYNKRYVEWLNLVNPLIDDGNGAVLNVQDEVTPARLYRYYYPAMLVYGIATEIVVKQVLEDSDVAEDDILATIDVQLPWRHAKNDYALRLRVDYVENLKAKKFLDEFGVRIHVGQTNDRVRMTYFEAFLNMVLFVAATVAAPFTGGASLALYFAIVAVVFAVLAYIAARLGYTAFAQQLMVSSQMYSYLSMAMGIMNPSSVVTTEIAKQGIVEYIKNVALDFINNIINVSLESIIVAVQKMTTQEVIGMIVTWLNRAFSVYVKYINPPNKGLEELNDTVKKQEEELAAMETPDNIQAIHTFLDTPFNNMYDFNEVMHNSYYNMTQSKIDGPMNKYYKGTEPFKYDPYWGG